MKRFLVLTLLSTVRVQSEHPGNIVEKINIRSVDDQEPDSLSLFRDALRATNMLDAFLGNHDAKFTVFAPTNRAFWDSTQFQLYMEGLDEKPLPRWHQNLKHALQQHIVADLALNFTDIFDLQRDDLTSLRDSIPINQFEFMLQDANVTEADIQSTNGVLMVIDKVLRPNFFSESFAQLELLSEYGPDKLNRTSLVDVVDHVGARELLNRVSHDGLTFVGCRIRAFNRLPEYLPQAVNESPNGVIDGEFLNSTFKEETIINFLQYSMIPKNYYNEDIPDDNKFVELIVPMANCGHMWVTKRNGELCFNNGCVVHEPDWLEYSAMNGYVVNSIHNRE